MDITVGYEPASGSSILSGPAILKHIYSTLVGKALIGSIPKNVFQYGGLVLIGNTCALQA